MQSFDFMPNGLYQVTWSSPATNRLLFEAGASLMYSKWVSTGQAGVGPADIPITEQRTGLLYNARSVSYAKGPKYVQRFSTSYITGSHAFKVGYMLEHAYRNAGPIS